MDAPRHLLVLGGQRSGKSRFAEEVVTASGRKPVYLATAEARDGEMAERIAAHRARRGEGWRTLEVPLDLASAVALNAAPGTVLLVDCLTLWLSNLFGAGADIEAETGRLVDILETASGPVVLVSNEVGAGIIPDNALARRFADAQGTLNRQVADAVADVILMVAGRPLRLKPAPAPEITL